MKNSGQKRNNQAIACYQNAEEFIIGRLLPVKKENQYLKISKKTSEIGIIKILDKPAYSMKVFSAFLGIALIEDQKFILMCQQCKRASCWQAIQIFEIQSLSFISYIQQKQLKEKANIKQISQKIRDYSLLLKYGFYFSHQYNPTMPFFNQKKQEIALKFSWNRPFLQQLNKNKIGFEWNCPVIQGFVSSFEIFHLGVKMKYLLITRRSTQKGGTRYFDRGINDEGYVANFCQTEQIIKIDEFTFSDLQIRGSLPIFFQQVGLYTKTKVNRSFELTHQVYTKHKLKLTNKYKRVFMVNLLSMGKRGEKLLTEQIQSHVKNENDPLLKYLYYDFHHVVKGNNFNRVDQMIIQLRKMKTNLGCYVYDQKREKIMSEQKGVFRTNCLDCLDRTNFFQAKLALITIESIFRQLNISTSNLLDEMKGDKDNVFIRKFRNIWADNGDAVSYHYTGTGSTHTDITRDGKRGWIGTIKHKYKSVARFYNQNFWDFYKMKVVSSLFGNKEYLSKSDLNEQLKNRQKQYKTFDKVSIFIMTWKAPKIVPKALVQFPKDLGLIIISIQDLNEQQRWIKRIQESLDINQYILVQSQCVHHNMLRIYAHRNLKSRISSVQQGKIKFSSYYNALISNKSANLIRFNLDNSKLVFVGCQLEKGREYEENRIKNIKEIHQYAFQVEEVGIKKSETIFYDDYIFLIGNMNTNIAQGFKNQLTFLSKVKNVDENADKIIQKMLTTDQFSHIKLNILEYRNYQEAPIHFPPTYKFYNGAFDLDCSGWPDRIWYSGEGKISCKNYNVIEQLRQQHVPVVGHYSVQVCKIDKEMQQAVGKELIQRNQSKGEVGVGDLQEQDQSENITL